MKYKIISFTFFLLFGAFNSHAQISTGVFSASPSFSSALNGTTRAQAASQYMAGVSNGVIGYMNAGISKGDVQNNYGNYFSRNQDVLINYDIPHWVVFDRFVLVAYILKEQADYLALQQQVQGLDLPQQSKQSLIDLYQQQIDKLQNIYYALGSSCVATNFKDYSTRVNADVRYNPPFGGATGGLLLSQNGIPDFNNVPYSVLEGNAVKATLLIYRK